uniref:Uncharacterized protein n=1 Tax=Neobodo designis TaxID=312471 RepID=A0A7S1Q0S5_NEODS
MWGDDLPCTVPAGSVGAVCALCYAHCAPEHVQGTSTSLRAPMPPPLVPMLAYLLGGGMDFGLEALVPALSCQRPAAAGRPRNSSVGVSADDDVRALVDAVCRGFSRDGDAAISPPSPQRYDGTSAGTSTAPLDDANPRRLAATLAGMPCPIVRLTLPRAHRAGVAAGLNAEGTVSACRVGRATGVPRQSLPGLRHLDASECTFERPADVAAMLDPSSLASGLLADAASSIESLALRRVVFAQGDQQLNVLADAFLAWRAFDFPRLTHVDLSYNDSLPDDAVCRLVSHPSLAQGLRTLRLWLTPVSDVAIAAIADHCDALTALELSNCTRLADSALELIARSRFAAGLRVLTMSFTAITDAGLAQHAERFRSLERVDMRSCAVGDHSVQALVDSCGASLRQLDLTNLEPVKMRPAGGGVSVRGAASAMQQPPARGVTDATVVKIASRCSKLRHLAVMNSKAITGAALQRFLSSRTDECPIEHLDLRGTGADDGALQPLLVRPVAIAHLVLWQCGGVTDTFLNAFADTGAPALEHLDLCYTNVTAQGVANFVVRVACAQAGCTEADAAMSGEDTPAAYARRASAWCARVRLQRVLFFADGTTNSRFDAVAAVNERIPFLQLCTFSLIA